MSLDRMIEVQSKQYLIDFYNESSFTIEWMNMTDSEKEAKLDKDIAAYMKSP